MELSLLGFDVVGSHWGSSLRNHGRFRRPKLGWGDPASPFSHGGVQKMHMFVLDILSWKGFNEGLVLQVVFVVVGVGRGRRSSTTATTDHCYYCCCC